MKRTWRQPKVTLVTLNWNTAEETIECLDSLRAVSYGRLEVVVIDNGSDDDSLRTIRDFLAHRGAQLQSAERVEWRDKRLPVELYKVPTFSAEGGGFLVRLVATGWNSGFPGGNNIGIGIARKTGAKYVLLLNNDTVVDPPFLDELVEAAEKDTAIGIAGSKVYFHASPRLIQTAGGFIHWFTGSFENRGNQIDRGQWDQVMDCDAVYATSMLVRTALFERIGELDEFFVFGIEEYDLCVRARSAGFRTVYVPTSRIWHKGGRSAAKLTTHPQAMAMISKTRGLLGLTYEVAFFKKHLGYPLAVFPICFRTISILLGVCRDVIFVVIKKQSSVNPNAVGGVGRIRRLEAEALVRRFLTRKRPGR